MIVGPMVGWRRMTDVGRASLAFDAALMISATAAILISLLVMVVGVLP